MKAVYYNKTGNAKKVLKIGDFKNPKIKPNEVLVKIAYSSVNPADTKKRSGWISNKLNNEFIIPHTDGSGKIVDVSDKKYKYLLNKKVWILGGSKDQIYGTCAEYFSVNVNNVNIMPEQINYSEASCLGVPVATAYYSIFSEKKNKEKYIFISGGAGAVSQYAIQFAKLNGSKVITTVSSKVKENICKKLGADLVINYKKTTFKELTKNIIEFTKGNLVDRCIEVDFGSNIKFLPEIIKNNGIISSYSSSKIINPIFPYYSYAPKGINIKIVQAFLHHNNYLKKISNYINKLILTKKLLHPKIKTFQLKNSYKAHEYIENSTKIGKANIKFI